MPNNQHVPDNFGTNYSITYTGNIVTYMQRARNANADNRAFNQTKNMMERRAISNRGVCPNCLNPSTTGNNLLGLTYPGGNNPKSLNGQYNYSYVPSYLSEYPAIGHDRRYDNLEITRASGLFLDTRAIGADWRFVAEEFKVATNNYLNPYDRMSAGILGLGLGLSALPKTIYQLSIPAGFIQTIIWYNISNIRVNNTPIIHRH